MGTYNRKDHLYQKAKSSGYRSRAAYKLLELDKRYRLFKPGSRVLDLGSFPGGWLQVACERVGAKGAVVGIDLKDVEPVQVKVGGFPVNPFIIKGDITEASVRDEVISRLGAEADLVLSDLSPQLSGIRFRDVALAAELVEMAYDVSSRVLRKGGTLVAKIFPGPEADEVFKNWQREFKKVSRAKLKSTRKTSTELYLVAQGFRLSRAPKEG